MPVTALLSAHSASVGKVSGAAEAVNTLIGAAHANTETNARLQINRNGALTARVYILEPVINQISDITQIATAIVYFIVRDASRSAPLAIVLSLYFYAKFLDAGIDTRGCIKAVSGMSSRGFQLCQCLSGLP